MLWWSRAGAIVAFLVLVLTVARFSWPADGRYQFQVQQAEYGDYIWVLDTRTGDVKEYHPRTGGQVKPWMYEYQDDKVVYSDLKFEAQ